MSQTSTEAASRWFHSAVPRPDAAVRLFAVPHAGGSAAAYARWARLLPAEVELLAVQLPGRQNRRAEDPYTAWEPLVEALYDAVEGELDGRPFAFFGHSMGALLAYRLTVAMEREGGPAPRLLAVSGWSPAAHRDDEVAVDRLSDEEFLRQVEEFGALPPEVTEDEELRSLVLPTLRADFTVAAGFRPDGAAVACPLVCYGGQDDGQLTTTRRCRRQDPPPPAARAHGCAPRGSGRR